MEENLGLVSQESVNGWHQPTHVRRSVIIPDEVDQQLVVAAGQSGTTPNELLCNLIVVGLEHLSSNGSSATSS